MKKKIQSFTFSLLKISLAGGLLFYLFQSGRLDPKSLSSLLTPSVLIGGALALGGVFYLASERWRLLLNQQGFDTDRGYAFQLTLIGNFFNFFIPGGVGGDVVKALLVASHNPIKKGRAILTVLADRILGLFTMVTLGLIAFAFEPTLLAREKSFQLIFLLLVVLFFGFMVAFWLILTTQKTPLHRLIDWLSQKLPRIGHAWSYAQSYRLTTTQILRFTALSFAAQLCSIMLFMLVARELTPEIPSISVFFFAVPVGFMVTAIPISPAGIGIGQAAFLFLFSKAIGAETNIGVIGVTAYQAFQMLYGIPGAIIFTLLKKKDHSLSIQSLSDPSNN